MRQPAVSVPRSAKSLLQHIAAVILRLTKKLEQERMKASTTLKLAWTQCGNSGLRAHICAFKIEALAQSLKEIIWLCKGPYVQICPSHHIHQDTLLPDFNTSFYMRYGNASHDCQYPPPAQRNRHAKCGKQVKKLNATNLCLRFQSALPTASSILQSALSFFLIEEGPTGFDAPINNTGIANSWQKIP